MLPVKSGSKGADGAASLEPAGSDEAKRFALQHPGYDAFLRTLANVCVERWRHEILTQCRFVNEDEDTIDDQRPLDG